jgi:hypothetical protein
MRRRNAHSYLYTIKDKSVKGEDLVYMRLLFASKVLRDWGDRVWRIIIRSWALLVIPCLFEGDFYCIYCDYKDSTAITGSKRSIL